MKRLCPYQFGFATISGFRDHSDVKDSRTNQNQLVNIYLIRSIRIFPMSYVINHPNRVFHSNIDKNKLDTILKVILSDNFGD